MFLIRKENDVPRDPNGFPTAQLAFLALVRLSEPIAITSIFPYAWKLVLHLRVGDPSNASFYAGILISAFAFAECISSMFWGAMSDRIGRKPVLLLGCCGTILGLIVVGCATNFWMALVGRALGGLLNGNQGVVQTMVAELVTAPEHEPRAYAVMPFVWSVGTMIGPAIGGYFADPAVNFPTVFSADGLFGRFPYLFLNIICSVILLIAVVLGVFLIKETHPGMQPWTKAGEALGTSQTPLFATAGTFDNPPVDLRRPSYGTFNAVIVEQIDSRPPPFEQKPKAFTKDIIMLTVALGIFTYHSMCYDNLIPIFFQDKRGEMLVSHAAGSTAFSGGLGLSTRAVGIIMFFNGFSALLIQGIIFPMFASWVGIWKLFIGVTLGHPISYIIVPYLGFLPPAVLYPGIYAALTIRNIFAILAYPVLLILLKEASQRPSCLGKINGLAASAGASCRMLASPISGFLYSEGTKKNFTPLAWWVTAGVAVFGVVQMAFTRKPEKEHKARVSSVAYLVRPAEHETDRKDRQTETTAVAQSETRSTVSGNAGYAIVAGHEDMDQRT